LSAQLSRIGARSFAVAGPNRPKAWNHLPADIYMYVRLTLLVPLKLH